MAFVCDKQVAVGKALASAQLEIFNAQEAGHNAESKLWHIYKAQKKLKEAAALLVQDSTDSSQSSQGETIDRRHIERDETTNRVETLGVIDSLTAALRDITEQSEISNKWIALTKSVVERCDNPKPLLNILAECIKQREEQSPE